MELDLLFGLFPVGQMTAHVGTRPVSETKERRIGSRTEVKKKNILEASLRCSEQLKLVSQQRRNRRLQVGQVGQTEEEKE